MCIREWAKRAKLRVGEGGIGKKMDELQAMIIKSANAIVARERSRVKEHARCSMIQPVEDRFLHVAIGFIQAWPICLKASNKSNGRAACPSQSHWVDRFSVA